jgi:hypothetical protein
MAEGHAVLAEATVHSLISFVITRECDEGLPKAMATKGMFLNSLCAAASMRLFPIQDSLSDLGPGYFERTKDTLLNCTSNLCVTSLLQEFVLPRFELSYEHLHGDP